MLLRVCVRACWQDDDAGIIAMIKPLPVAGSAGAREGPKKAIARVADSFESDAQRLAWTAEVRVLAILESIPGSVEKVKTGLRRWFEFFRNVIKGTGSSLPPTHGHLIAYSRVFDHPKTYRDYIGYIRVGCELIDAPLDVFAHVSIARAIKAVANRARAVPREPMFIRYDLITQIVRVAREPGNDFRVGIALLAGYVCLLRVPSECLPAVAHRVDSRKANQNMGCTPVVRVSDGVLEWYLPRRKNRWRPVTIKRKCWCSTDKDTCPVHVIGAYVQGLKPGMELFEGVHKVRARVSLALAFCRVVLPSRAW